MKALAINCTLKSSPEESNTEALAQVLLDTLAGEGTEVELIRAVDYSIDPGVASEPQSGDDQWPAVRRKIVAAEILIIATPTWLGQPSSVAKRVLERMDAMISENRDDGRPIAYDRVAGVVVTGNEDGAHHCIAEIAGALNDIGYTIPGQAWTYWNKGPGPGEEEYLSSEDKEWSQATGRTAAQNLLASARALSYGVLPLPVRS